MQLETETMLSPKTVTQTNGFSLYNGTLAQISFANGFVRGNAEPSETNNQN
jgi:hypothetical protein